MQTDAAAAPPTPTRWTDVGGLRIASDERVLEPRPWTAAQGEWAREILTTAPQGPVLEVCSGAGHIGLVAIRGTDRWLVAVDLNPAAADFFARNAAAAGLAAQVEARTGLMDDPAVVAAGERFAVVVADPPWVTHERVGDFPDDPVVAIDGGADGLTVARTCLRVADAHLADGGTLLLQLGDVGQAERLAAEPAVVGSLRLSEVRTYERGVVARFDPHR
ncbi:MAG: RsmD family RNA methyltransferase [Nocardioides sp.]|nr:RsmD family RNA methyltransferase [Nocardioides sp.]